MILVGLTGGIGSGKSTVSTLLAAKGAVIIDGDVIARELQQPGTPVLEAIVARFGDDVIDANYELNRAVLAAIVFPQPDELAALNAIVHPALAIEIRRRIDAEMSGDRVVVLDMPLLAENPRTGLCGVVVVDIDPKIARERLINFRQMKRDDVDARMARQSSREQRQAVADLIIDNSGDQHNLQKEVDRAWEWMQNLPQAQPGAGNLVQ